MRRYFIGLTSGNLASNTHLSISHQIKKGILFTVDANNVVNVFAGQQVYDNSSFWLFK